MMITNKRLKIWVIVTHALIIVGYGHGGFCFAIFEVFAIAGFFREIFHLNWNVFFETDILIVCLIILLGQIAIIISLFNKIKTYKTISFIAGLFAFWISVIYFIYITKNDEEAGFATFSAIPFFICTIIAFFGNPIKKFYYWVIDKETED